jgi:hypothetical protein
MTNEEKLKLLNDRNDAIHKLESITEQIYGAEDDWFAWAINNDPKIRFAYNQGAYDERHSCKNNIMRIDQMPNIEGWTKEPISEDMFWYVRPFVDHIGQIQREYCHPRHLMQRFEADALKLKIAIENATSE